jgi:dipeptidase E
VAIGGGDIRTRGTAEIDREIIRLSGRKNPSVLFIPTASYDSLRYWERVKEYFGKFLNCTTDVLLLISGRLTDDQIRKKILSADIIYVGGGNTLYMMRLWRRLGVDKLLKQAYENGTVLAGISAGAICWFDSGHSDSMSFYGGMGVAIENNCAIEFIDGRFYRVISSKPDALAYRVYKKGGGVVVEQMRQYKRLTPLECLFDRTRRL